MDPGPCADNDAGDLLPSPSPSATPEIKGDWVLFHPVYSPEELTAVEVSSFGEVRSLVGRNHTFAYRFYIQHPRSFRTSLLIRWLEWPGKRNAGCICENNH